MHVNANLVRIVGEIQWLTQEKYQLSLEVRGFMVISSKGMGPLPLLTPRHVVYKTTPLEFIFCRSQVLPHFEDMTVVVNVSEYQECSKSARTINLNRVSIHNILKNKGWCMYGVCMYGSADTENI